MKKRVEAYDQLSIAEPMKCTAQICRICIAFLHHNKGLVFAGHYRQEQSNTASFSPLLTQLNTKVLISEELHIVESTVQVWKFANTIKLVLAHY
jgi:hypothetical protein